MMSRIEFMNRLESLLSDIPMEERKEALQYYSDYFDDAGEEHEEAIIEELGSPERVASIIKVELDGNSINQESRGYFTEKGYQDAILMDEKYEIVGSADQEENHRKDYQKHEAGYQQETENYSQQREHQQQEAENYSQQREYQQNGYGYKQQSKSQQTESNQQERYKKNTNVGLIVLLCILAIPVGIPALATIFGITVALLATVMALFIGFGVAGLTMMGVGTALVITGVIKLGIPFVGFLLCGVGLLSLGGGMLLVMLTIFIGRTVIPAIVRGFVHICRLPFKNRSVMV